jgi:DNA-binding MarR family transcriptional regulator
LQLAREFIDAKPLTFSAYAPMYRRVRQYQETRLNMARTAGLGPDDCNCLAVRQAARHITQFYDQFLAPGGLRTTQFSILAKLRRAGPMTINRLAADLVMDRTTLGRNILPLERDGLIAVEQESRDRRSKILRVTEAGEARFRAGARAWAQAQQQFEAAFGAQRTKDMRALLHAVAATDLGTGGATAEH